ncbi:MAG: hypothetical protein KGD63_06980 [Candidatus Lokiarchaeota archaeon]|nr:hypothetical protein [Candidatus Lokiarchaeota archaeon]
MVNLFEIGIVFRGFVIVNHKFTSIPDMNPSSSAEDLRGAFIDAINSFAKSTFNNCSLEYLEMQNLLFIFKIGEILAGDSNMKEPFIMYGLSKRKRNSDKFVKKFYEKLEFIMQYFKQKYTGEDFTEIQKFQDFKKDLEDYFS